MKALESHPQAWLPLDALSIGSVDRPDAVSHVGVLLALAGGDVWLAQPMQHVVRIVYAYDRLVRSVRGGGQGHGELMAIGRLGFWSWSPDTIWVLDGVPRRLSVITVDRTFVRTVNHPLWNTGMQGEYLLLLAVDNHLLGNPTDEDDVMAAC